MMKAALMLAGSVALAGLSACSSIQPSEKAAVDYNRSFARARDEVLVINVLRASERHPLQFSTISAVSGGLKSGASIKIPFTNIIAGGADAISPELTLNNRNPTVTITPLSTKEFIQGISRPLSPTIIDDLLSQGWNREVVLSLVVGAVVCADRTVVMNGGGDPARDRLFVSAFKHARQVDLDEAPTFATLRMTGKDAMSFIKDGAGPAHEIESVKNGTNKAGDPEAIVNVTTPSKARIQNLNLSAACQGPGPDTFTPADVESTQGYVAATAHKQAGEVPSTGVLLRSVQGIFSYLGNLQRRNLSRQVEACDQGAQTAEDPDFLLFNLRLACNQPVPAYSVVSTDFQGRKFFIQPLSQAGAGDLTLDTLSILNQLIELQTSDAVLRSTTPFIAITQQ